MLLPIFVRLDDEQLMIALRSRTEVELMYFMKNAQEYDYGKETIRGRESMLKAITLAWFTHYGDCRRNSMDIERLHTLETELAMLKSVFSDVNRHVEHKDDAMSTVKKAVMQRLQTLKKTN